MGTSAVVIYVHHGIVYAIHKSGDGYLEHVGTEVVIDIPPDRDAFEAWLRKKRKFLDKEKRRIKELERKYDAEKVKPLEREYDPYLEKPSRRKYPTGEAKYEYIVDLDEEIFSVCGKAFFSLQNIPRGKDNQLWIRYLDCDQLGYFLRPDAPKCYHKRPRIRYPPDISEEGLELYRGFATNVRIVDESSWMRDSDAAPFAPSLALSSAITRGLLHSHNNSFHIARDTDSHSEIFNAKSEVLLRAVSPAGLSLMRGHGYDPCRSPENTFMSSKFKYFYTYHRYRGCVIMLTRDCSTGKRLEEHVGLAVLHARETMKDNCTVIIFSFNHVAVVTIQGALSKESGKLQVTHSQLYRFLDVLGHPEFETSFRLLAHYLRPHCIDGGLLIPNTRSRQIVPFDVISRIMQLVDLETHDSFRFVSKAVRREWFLHPRIENYTIFGVKDVGKKGFLHLPRYAFRALDERGDATRLFIYKQSPCASKILMGECQCGCYEEDCCPCPNACVYESCGSWTTLRVPLRYEEMYPEMKDEEYFFTDKYFALIRKSRRKCPTESQIFEPNLYVFDQRESCGICSREEIGCALSTDEDEEVCLREIT